MISLRGKRQGVHPPAKRRPYEPMDITGYKHPRGRLTAVEPHRAEVDGWRWWCNCDCGNPERKSVKIGDLRSGQTKSCGCLRRENVRKNRCMVAKPVTTEHAPRKHEKKPAGEREGTREKGQAGVRVQIAAIMRDYVAWRDAGSIVCCDADPVRCFAAGRCTQGRAA